VIHQTPTCTRKVLGHLEENSCPLLDVCGH
jgi:hypothetical protein